MCFLPEVRAQQAQRSELDALAGRCAVRALFEDWHRKEASKRKDGGAEIRRAFEKDVLPTLGQFAAEDVKRRQVMAVLDKVMERGVGRYANILLQYLRQIFTLRSAAKSWRTTPPLGFARRMLAAVRASVIACYRRLSCANWRQSCRTPG
jgi:hypothetical protein